VELLVNAFLCFSDAGNSLHLIKGKKEIIPMQSKNKKWFSGLLAAALTLSLAGADVALAQGRGGGQGPGGGGTCPMYQSGQGQSDGQYGQQGQGRKRGQRRQQRLRDGSCGNNPNQQAPATTPAPSN
jgi:hypothetical protein